MTEQQTNELKRLKAYFPFRIVFGAIDKDTGAFSAYCKKTMRTANSLAKSGHSVWIYK